MNDYKLSPLDNALSKVLRAVELAESLQKDDVVYKTLFQNEPPFGTVPDISYSAAEKRSLLERKS